MRKLFVFSLQLLFVSVLGLSPAQAAVTDHALVKTISFPAKVVKYLGSHPIEKIKAVAGTVVFAAEEGVDAAHLGFAAADAATGIDDGKVFGIVHQVFHESNEYTGAADTWLEKKERQLFGRSD